MIATRPSERLPIRPHDASVSESAEGFKNFNLELSAMRHYICSSGDTTAMVAGSSLIVAPTGSPLVTPAGQMRPPQLAGLTLGIATWMMNQRIGV